MAKSTGTGRGISGEGPPAQDVSLRERLTAFRHLPEFFRRVWRVSPVLAVANMVLRGLRATLPLALLYVGKLIIDEVVLLVGTPGNTHHLWILVAAEFGLAVVSDLLGRAVALVDAIMGDLFSNETSLQLMDHAARLDLYHFEDSEFYDRLDRARRQTSGRVVLMSQVFGQMQDLVTIIVLGAGLVAFNPWLIVLLLVALVPAFLGESHFNARSYALMHRWTPERRQLDYLRYAGASDETAKELKIFGLSGFLRERYRTLADRFTKANIDLSVRRAGWGGVLAIVGSGGYYAAYILIIVKTVSGQLTLGDLTFLAGSFSRLRSLLEGVLGRFTAIADGALYLSDLYEFFEIEPRVKSPENPLPFPRPIREGFRLESVGFKYPKSDRWALRNVSCIIRPGERLALVGENGSGKTTFIKLVTRLYDPTEGRILLDGHDLREYNLEQLRRDVGVIFQDFVHYQMTASENIAIGLIEEADNRPRIEHAANQSLADTVIARLPKGYDQMVGRRFEGGIELSGGEWQKIALARAYMRDAQLLVLDEPTASLDARAEYEIFQRFSDLTKGRTALLISHRFSTVRMADRILVLHNGELEEQGTHEQLLAGKKRYAELFRLQAEGYV